MEENFRTIDLETLRNGGWVFFTVAISPATVPGKLDGKQGCEKVMSEAQ